MNYPYENVGKPDAPGVDLDEEGEVTGGKRKEIECKDMSIEDTENKDEGHYAIPKPMPNSQSSVDGKYCKGSKSRIGLDFTHEKDAHGKSKMDLESSHEQDAQSKSQTVLETSYEHDAHGRPQTDLESSQDAQNKFHTVPEFSHEKDARNNPQTDHAVDTQNKSKPGLESANEADEQNNAGKSADQTDGHVATKARLLKYKKCSLHTLEDVVFFCMPCDKQICQRCLVPKHLKHDVNNLEDVTVLFRAKIQEKLQLAQKQSAIWRRDLNTLKDMRTSYQITLDQEYEKIGKCVTKNADRISAEGMRLTNELDSVAQLVSNAIAKDKTQLQNRMDTLRSALESCKNHAAATKEVPNHEVIKQQKVILDDLTHQCNSSTVLRLQIDKIHYPAIHFEEQPQDDTLSIGKILMAPELRLMQEFDGILLAASIAKTPTGDFLVADEEGCEVLVYRMQDGVYKQETPLNFSESPLGVAVTANNQYLVSTKDAIMTFSVSGDWLPNFTSSLSKSRYLGPLYESNERLFGGHVRSPFITEFDIEGDPIRTIHMPHKCAPRRFALIDDAKMAVCYHDISGVDIIKFEKQLGNEVSVLLHIDIRLPLSLCLDEKSNCLFIGHCQRSNNPSELRSKRYKTGTGVIDQYCCISGQFVGRLVRGLYSPLCMKMITESTLAVADGKTVKLYEVQRRSI